MMYVEVIRFGEVVAKVGSVFAAWKYCKQVGLVHYNLRVVTSDREWLV